MQDKRRTRKPALAKSITNEAHQLVEWLNGPQGNAMERERIAALVRDVLHICESKPMDIKWPTAAAFAALEASGFDMDRPITDALPLVKDWVVMPGPRAADLGILERTQAALAKYSFKPALNLYSRPVKGKPSFRIVLSPSQIVDRMSNADTHAIRKRASKPSAPEDEAWMVLRVVNLAAQGELHLVKECACGKWFFLARTNRRHCSAECRKAAYEQKPGRKAEKRKYMRKYMRERYAETFGAPKTQSTREGARKANGKA